MVFPFQVFYFFTLLILMDLLESLISLLTLSFFPTICINIIITVILKSLSDNSYIWVISGLVSIDYFLSEVWAIFFSSFAFSWFIIICQGLYVEEQQRPEENNVSSGEGHKSSLVRLPIWRLSESHLQLSWVYTLLQLCLVLYLLQIFLRQN